MNEAELYCVYLLQCRDGSLYTGIAKDLRRRIATHNSGKGAKYTRSRRPVRLRFAILGLSKSAALVSEYEIKQLSRDEKFMLLACSDPISQAVG